MVFSSNSILLGMRPFDDAMRGACTKQLTRLLDVLASFLLHWRAMHRFKCQCEFGYRRVNMSCVICSDTFTKESIIVATPCGHLYHKECMETELK